MITAVCGSTISKAPERWGAPWLAFVHQPVAGGASEGVPVISSKAAPWRGPPSVSGMAGDPCVRQHGRESGGDREGGGALSVPAPVSRGVSPATPRRADSRLGRRKLDVIVSTAIQSEEPSH